MGPQCEEGPVPQGTAQSLPLTPPQPGPKQPEPQPLRPQVLSATPPHPQGPLPVPTSLFGLITLEGKGETFSLLPAWGRGYPSPRGAGTPSRAHLLPFRPRPQPSPAHASPAPPSRKGAGSLPGPPAWLGRSSKEAQAGEEGPRGQGRGRCGIEREGQDLSPSRRWERGLGCSRGKSDKGGPGFIGVQSPGAKEW